VKKEEGRRKKEEGRRKTEDRRQAERGDEYAEKPSAMLGLDGLKWKHRI